MTRLVYVYAEPELAGNDGYHRGEPVTFHLRIDDQNRSVSEVVMGGFSGRLNGNLYPFIFYPDKGRLDYGIGVGQNDIRYYHTDLVTVTLQIGSTFFLKPEDRPDGPPFRMKIRRIDDLK